MDYRLIEESRPRLLFDPPLGLRKKRGRVAYNDGERYVAAKSPTTPH
jgi:hypothetical protein